MPTYEYKCSNCGQLTEAFQKMSDAPLVTCPHCGKDTLTRIVSGGVGVIYKGEGWYVTDYSHKSSGGKEMHSESKSSSEKVDPLKPKTTATPQGGTSSESSSSAQSSDSNATPTKSTAAQAPTTSTSATPAGSNSTNKAG